MSRTKRTIRKEVKYNSDEWEKMIFLSKKSGKNPAAYIREKTVSGKIMRLDLERTDLDMIIKTAEKTNSEHLEKLKELKKRFENCRRILNRYYYQLLNID